jgi:hypothetical protein
VSILTAWQAVRSALSSHVLAQWGVAVQLNSSEALVTTASLPISRLYTVVPVPIQVRTVTDDYADISFTIHGIWARPAGVTDLEAWAMDKAELVRNAIASDFHLGGACTDASVDSIYWSLPDLSPNNKWVQVFLNVTAQTDFVR